MSSIFSGTENSKLTRWHVAIPSLQLDTSLIVLGIVLLCFGLFLAPLIPADARSGHRFWVRVVTADELIALVLLVTGGIKRYFRSSTR